VWKLLLLYFDTTRTIEGEIFGGQDGCFMQPQGHDGVFVFSVVPMKVLAFAKGSFSQTRHEF